YIAPRMALPQSWAEFRDPQRSPLNPLWKLDSQEPEYYSYGHFPMYLGVLTGVMMEKLAPLAERIGAPTRYVEMMQQATDACRGIAIPGRLVIALLDTLTILLIFLLGRRIMGAGGGLIAAAFYAFAAQAIQLSHFFAMDPASTTFTVLTVLGGVMMVQERSWRAAVVMGIGAGLAVSSKFSALPILAVPVVAGLLVVMMEAARARGGGPPAQGRDQLVAILGVLVAFVIAIVAFAVTSPYAILDRQTFLEATLVRQGAMVRGIADLPFTRQYRNTTPYLYFIEQQVEWGLWWPLGVLAVVGSLWMAGDLLRALWRLLRGDWISEQAAANIVLWSWVAPYFGITGAFMAKFNRYMSPMLPFVLLFAAMLIAKLWRWGANRAHAVAVDDTTTEFDIPLPAVAPMLSAANASSITAPDMRTRAELQDRIDEETPIIPHQSVHVPEHTFAYKPNDALSPPVRVAAPLPAPLRWGLRLLAVLLTLVGIGGGLFWSAAYVNGVYNHVHPWLTASRWLAENVPSGSVILCEQWDDCLPPGALNDPEVIAARANFSMIDWGPYEEDSEAKYETLKERLRTADFVVYASKRIYDSVDELPARYPMTNLYYKGMWSGALGFELALDVTTPPQLWGFVFEDRGADESWSLYDHPQVTIFRKTRNLTDAEFEAYFDHSWASAVAWDRGQPSAIAPLLNALGLGGEPGSEQHGLINRLIQVLMGESDSTPESVADRKSLMLDAPLDQLPIVDNYRWNTAASTNVPLGVFWWWLVVALLGWLAWPLCFALLRPLRDRGYLVSRTVGWLLSGWLLWQLASVGWAVNSVANSWLAVALLGLVGLGAAILQGRQMLSFLRRNWGLLLASEALFAVAYLFFVYIRLRNPDLWQPWQGGEKFMEFAFVNGVLRSPSFPPVDPHFAGGYINYYYFGLYLVAFLIKLTGIYAEVAFNLAIPTLFALTVVNTFAVAYSALRSLAAPVLHGVAQEAALAAATAEPDAAALDSVIDSENAGESTTVAPTAAAQTAVDAADVAQASSASAVEEAISSRPLMPAADVMEPPVYAEDASAATITVLDDSGDEVEVPLALTDDLWSEPWFLQPIPWQRGFITALLAPLFVVIIGNLDGFAQVVRALANQSVSQFQSALPGLETLVHAFSGLRMILANGQPLPAYDFWGPSRVIPATINEFPYWSFLFADLHPHLIGMPLTALFLALLLVLVREYAVVGRLALRRGLSLLLFFSLLLGTLTSVNFWEAPTYLGLGVFGFVVAQYFGRGRINWALTVLAAIGYGALTYLLYYPFFANYVGVGASGVGLVRTPDEPGTWLLIWGFLGFVIVSWLFFAVQQPARARTTALGRVARPTGMERWLSLAVGKFNRLPRFLYLHRLLVQQPSLGYLFAIVLWPLLILVALLAWWLGYGVIALCVAPLGAAFLLMWRRGRASDAGTVFAALLISTGLAILAGTQIIFLKDFLAGGDWYRMNTLFKFFSQVWMLWGVAAAIVLPRFWRSVVVHADEVSHQEIVQEEALHGDAAAHTPPRTRTRGVSWPLRLGWTVIFVLLLIPSLAFLVLGTEDRVEDRFPGWRPAFGTLNGLDYMNQGVYTWSGRDQFGDELPPIEIQLMYDREAIDWL
ncbi:MAG: DUF2298 domain-containing protein, partial [Caldilineaceae bacterium]|nr:DUF2298 domain-containing protein [Caldilineaceae bacterium]